MSKYMIALVLAGFFPLILSFYPPLKFWRNFRSLILSIILIVLTFGTWDVWATWRNHWFFNNSGISGWKIINLPLEEWLFFVVIPFCCIFTWEALKFIAKKGR